MELVILFLAIALIVGAGMAFDGLLTFLRSGEHRDSAYRRWANDPANDGKTGSRGMGW